MNIFLGEFRIGHFMILVMGYSEYELYLFYVMPNIFLPRDLMSSM